MTINELHIQFDLHFENKIDILKRCCKKCNKGYLFIDSNDGHCYLFGTDGNEDDIKKIKSIRNRAFYNCQILKSIIIPDSVKSIGIEAFAWCENLKSIVIPNSIEWIEHWVFAYCKNLKSVIISNSVKWIGYCAFEYCKSLKSIEIPNSVESIGDAAFAHCESLKSVVFKEKTIDQVVAMENYPFGIKDESIIKCI